MATDMIECQTCGNPIKELSEAEKQRIAAKPENFVVWCGNCSADMLNEWIRSLNDNRN